MADTKREKLFTVMGIDVYSNSLYTVTAKPDVRLDYSEGLRDYGAKNPFTREGKSVPSFLSPDGKERLSYDLGLQINSPIWKGVSEDDAKVEIENIKKFVIDEFNKQRSPHNPIEDSKDLLKKGIVKVHQGKTYNTSNIDGLLDLYLAIISKAVCREEDVYKPKYEYTNYVVRNNSSIKDNLTSNRVSIIAASAEFYKLITENTTKANHILWYVTDNGMSDRSSDNNMLLQLFDDWVKMPQNAKIFMSALKDSEDKDKYSRIKLYGSLKRGLFKGKVKKDDGAYYFKGKYLGNSLDQITNKLIKSEDKEFITQITNI